MRNLLLSLSFVALASLTSCMHYSFSGSTLPAHIKTVTIPLPDNSTSKVGLEQKVYESVYAAYAAMNKPAVVRSGGDAELVIKIKGYQNNPDEFDAQGNVKTYKVIISADVRFTDKKENAALYEGTVSGMGVYNHTSETENTGIENALKKLNESIINNTISGW